MVTNRWGSRPHFSRVLSNWNNNFSNTESNFNNILSTLCNQCESSDHKSNDCFYKDKICDYCKKERHLQKICFKKQCDDRINDVTTNEENDSDYAFINTFIISEEFHKNQLTRYNSGRICLLQKSHYTFMIIVDSEVTCHAFYNKIMFKSIESTT